MKIQRILGLLAVVALLPMESWGQDTGAKPLQDWLDFLVTEATVPSVVDRIGQPDVEKSVAYMAPNAQLYVWYNRFERGPKKEARLELVAVPDNNPLGSQMMVIAIIDPNGPRGIYMPWAPRYVDNVPMGYHVGHAMMAALLNY
jgi:hypothetical protein